ncbi:ABC transporter ATP-binding protein [Streptacidiphilus sp. 4-A2]|nr:ABC transporter ATP-binding protein [Streptacidiphilus sp. 4-A2]
MAVRHWPVLALDSFFNMMWSAGLALSPAVIGEAVNSGLVAKDQTALIGWGLAVLGLGIVTALSALAVERLELRVKVEPGYRTMQFVTCRTCELVPRSTGRSPQVTWSPSASRTSA